MALRKFGNFYINVEKVSYAHRFYPDVIPANMFRPGSGDTGGVRIGFDQGETTIFDDEEGFQQFMQWLDEQTS
jgi:hypothetical protein